MAFPSLERSLNKVSNRYMLVALACKRARQINRGAAVRVTSRHTKPTSMALEEIAAAKVEYRVKEEGETAKPEPATPPSASVPSSLSFVGVNATPICQ